MLSAHIVFHFFFVYSEEMLSNLSRFVDYIIEIYNYPKRSMERKYDHMRTKFF